MNYYERHIGDYLKDTAHLTLLEHGVYCRLLDVYYTREAAIPDEQVARLIGAKTKDELAALNAVLREFFVLEEGGHWVQWRCEAEITRFTDKQKKARASANARWSNAKTHSDGSADAMRTHSEGNAPRARGRVRSQSPDPNTNTPTTPKGDVAEPQGFKTFWDAWPKNDRKQAKGKCLQAWAKGGFEKIAGEIVAHVQTMARSESWTKQGGQFVPSPQVYLNNRRWEGAELPQQSGLQLVGGV